MSSQPLIVLGLVQARNHLFSSNTTGRSGNHRLIITLAFIPLLGSVAVIVMAAGIAMRATDNVHIIFKVICVERSCPEIVRMLPDIIRERLQQKISSIQIRLDLPRTTPLEIDAGANA